VTTSRYVYVFISLWRLSTFLGVRRVIKFGNTPFSITESAGHLKTFGNTDFFFFAEKQTAQIQKYVAKAVAAVR